MFLARRPHPRGLDVMLAEARDMPLSYAPVGLARGAAPSPFRIDDERGVIGHGREGFARGARAIAAWRHFDLGWVSVYPPDVPTVPGREVLVVARHLGFWSVNACRILYPLGVGGQPHPGSEVAEAGSEVGGSGSEVAALGSEVGKREVVAGFAYGTLTAHAEAGEEIFEVSYDPGAGTVWYRVRAVSRENALLARLGFPISRALQGRFRRDSLAAMRRAVADSAT